MKKLIALIISVIAVIVSITFWPIFSLREKEEIKKIFLSVSPSPIISWKGVMVDEEKFAYSIIKISDVTKISLIFNEAKENSSEIVKKNNCLKGVSGGFYDENDRPLGLMISEGKIISQSIENSLFNGFVWINQNGYPGIDRGIAADNLRIGLQSGPILIENGQPVSLRIKDDFPARRIIAALTENQELIFMVIFNDEFKFQGPKLADLPKFVREIEKQEEIKLTSAINLDGGTASAFYSGDFSLSELSNVGSFFCFGE